MNQKRLFILCILAMLSVSVAVSAQDTSRLEHAPGEDLIVDPIDTYSTSNWGAERGILDNFAIRLLQNPKLIGYIVVYAGKRACIGAAEARGIRAKEYVVKYRGVEENRVVWKDAGYLDEPYVILEAQIRGEKPYPFYHPESLPKDKVGVLNCQAKGSRSRRRVK